MDNANSRKSKNPYSAEAARQLRKFANACRLDGDHKECGRIAAAAELLDPSDDVEETADVESAIGEVHEAPAPAAKVAGRRVTMSSPPPPRTPAAEQVIEYEWDIDDPSSEPVRVSKKNGKKKPVTE